MREREQRDRQTGRERQRERKRNVETPVWSRSEDREVEVVVVWPMSCTGVLNLKKGLHENTGAERERETKRDGSNRWRFMQPGPGGLCVESGPCQVVVYWPMPCAGTCVRD